MRALVRSLEERGLLSPHPGRTADATTYRRLTALDAALRRAKPADTTRAPAERP